MKLSLIVFIILALPGCSNTNSNGRVPSAAIYNIPGGMATYRCELEEHSNAEKVSIPFKQENSCQMVFISPLEAQGLVPSSYPLGAIFKIMKSKIKKDLIPSFGLRPELRLKRVINVLTHQSSSVGKDS